MLAQIQVAFSPAPVDLDTARDNGTLDGLFEFMEDYAPELFQSGHDLSDGAKRLYDGFHKPEEPMEPEDILEVLADKVEALPTNLGLNDAAQNQLRDQIMAFADKFADQCEEGNMIPGVMHDLYEAMAERFDDLGAQFQDYGFGS